MPSRKSALAVTSPLVKTLIFTAVGLFILAMLYIQLGEVRFVPQRTYTAEFEDVSGLQPASNVSANGVKIGRVDWVGVNNGHATATFTIDASRPLPTNVRIAVRYFNLTGDRYLNITPGPAPAPDLPDGGTIPLAQTTPALDLDVLMAGFSPLFEGLQPAEVNQLTGDLVRVLQGEGGTLESILNNVASLSGSLADRGSIIDSLIGNLNTVLASFDAHSGQLSSTVDRAQQLISALSADRDKLTRAVDRTADFTADADRLASAVRSGHDTIHELDRTSAVLDSQRGELNKILNLLPGAYLRLGRVASAGAAYQVYVCTLRLRLTGLDGQPAFTPQMGPAPNIKRCSDDDVAPLQGQQSPPGNR
jgi:phospholipid/cholesterol/gamma-HCH transport system substrate-binding protein